MGVDIFLNDLILNDFNSFLVFIYADDEDLDYLTSFEYSPIFNGLLYSSVYFEEFVLFINNNFYVCHYDINVREDDKKLVLKVYVHE